MASWMGRYLCRAGGMVRMCVVSRRREEPAFKKEHSRTAYLNGLAGAVNKVMGQLAGSLKPGSFYQELLSLLRAEPENHRLLLLRRLQGMELHGRYRLLRLAEPDLRITVEDDFLNVRLLCRSHPVFGHADADSYCWSLVLATWAEEGAKPVVQVQCGSWLPLDGPGAQFRFAFPVPAGAQHWLLGVKLAAGSKGKELGIFSAQGAQVYRVGSFDEAEQAWLDCLPRLSAIAPADNTTDTPPEPPRVQAEPLTDAD